MAAFVSLQLSVCLLFQLLFKKHFCCEIGVLQAQVDCSSKNLEAIWQSITRPAV